MIKLEIIEDLAVAASDWGALLRVCPGIEIVAITDNGDQAINLATQLQPKIILLDDTVAPGETATLIEELRMACNAYILIVGKPRPDMEILALLEAGANGYLNRANVSQHLEKAINVVAQGEVWISRKLVSLLLEHLRVVTSELET